MGQLTLECIVEVPDDEFDRNDIVTQIKEPWRALTNLLEHNGVKYQSKSGITNDSNPKPVTGAKRGRKPKVANHPGTLLATSNQAAAE